MTNRTASLAVSRDVNGEAADRRMSPLIRVAGARSSLLAGGSSRFAVFPPRSGEVRGVCHDVAMAGGGYACRRAGPADRPALLALCRSALGWPPGQRDEAFFTWKHDENPFGQSPSWVAETPDGTLVGVRVFLR